MTTEESSNHQNIQKAGEPSDRSFYNFVLNYISNYSTKHFSLKEQANSKKLKLLNIGTGITFIFERKLSSFSWVSISSMDIIDQAKIPGFIDNYYLQNVEEPFSHDTKYNIITFFELLEHIEKSDELLKNCYTNLNSDGVLIFSCPNLASIWGRIELLLGFQPHILEVSNENGNFGTGIFGKRFNNRSGEVVHHIRGFTTLAIKELLDFHGFKLIEVKGYGEIPLLALFFRLFPSLAPVNLFICMKKEEI